MLHFTSLYIRFCLYFLRILYLDVKLKFQRIWNILGALKVCCFLERLYQYKLVQILWESHYILNQYWEQSLLALKYSHSKTWPFVVIWISLVIGKVELISCICEHSLFCLCELSVHVIFLLEFNIFPVVYLSSLWFENIKS